MVSGEKVTGIAMYAVFKLGAIFVPINPRATSHELRHLASYLIRVAGVRPSRTPLGWPST